MGIDSNVYALTSGSSNKVYLLSLSLNQTFPLAGPAGALCVAPNSYLGIGQQPLAVPNAKPHPVPYYPYHLSPSI